MEPITPHCVTLSLLKLPDIVNFINKHTVVYCSSSKNIYHGQTGLYVPNSIKVALAIGYWQLGIKHLGIQTQSNTSLE